MEVEKEFESSLPKNTKAKEQSEASFSFNHRKTNRFKSYFRETFFFLLIIVGATLQSKKPMIEGGYMDLRSGLVL